MKEFFSITTYLSKFYLMLSIGTKEPEAQPVYDGDIDLGVRGVFNSEENVNVVEICDGKVCTN